MNFNVWSANRRTNKANLLIPDIYSQKNSLNNVAIYCYSGQIYISFEVRPYKEIFIP